MALNSLTYDTGVTTAINAFTALLNSGFIKIYTAPQPSVDGAPAQTLIATFTLPNPAFQAASASGSGGSAAANTITPVTASNTGTAAYFAMYKSDGVTELGTGTVGTSGCDLNLQFINISTGDPVTVTSFSVNQPQS